MLLSLRIAASVALLLTLGILALAADRGARRLTPPPLPDPPALSAYVAVFAVAFVLVGALCGVVMAIGTSFR